MKRIRQLSELKEFQYQFVIFRVNERHPENPDIILRHGRMGFISTQKVDNKFSPPTCIYVLSSPDTKTCLDASTLLSKELAVRLPTLAELEIARDQVVEGSSDLGALNADKKTILNALDRQIKVLDIANGLTPSKL